MTEELKNYTEECTYTADQKQEWWGCGQWVDEPDQVSFEYEGIQCIVSRIVMEGLDGETHGGHLCGYVRVPPAHPVYGKAVDDDSISSITYSKLQNAEHWIGFDYLNSTDYSPSIEHHNKTLPDFMKLEQDFAESLKKIGVDGVKRKYRNLDFCIENCKYIVKQLNEMVAK